MSRLTRRVSFVGVLLSLSCGGLDPTAPAGFDAGSARAAGGDGGVRDAGASTDAGVVVAVDAGSALDAGWPVDGGGDGGAADAGSKVDAGMPLDAGASRPDAGSSRDAGRVDAGVERAVVVCLTGAVDQTSGSNADFTDLCDRLALEATVVPSCTGATCFSSFATFPSTSASSSLANQVFTTLDRDHDGTFAAGDGPTSLTIIGFSWGGVNAASLADRLSSDSRIAHAALTLRLVVLDAFQPQASGVTAAANVDAAFSFRHTMAPSTDCSLGAPLGPYLGVRLRCPAGKACSDFDYSATFSSFQTPSGPVVGAAVGHCDVPLAAHESVRQIVRNGVPPPPLPPSIPVMP